MRIEFDSWKFPSISIFLWLNCLLFCDAFMDATGTNDPLGFPFTAFNWTFRFRLDEQNKSQKCDFLASKIIEIVTHFQVVAKMRADFPSFASFELKNWYFCIGMRCTCIRVCFRRRIMKIKILHNQKCLAKCVATASNQKTNNVSPI